MFISLFHVTMLFFLAYDVIINSFFHYQRYLCHHFTSTVSVVPFTRMKMFFVTTAFDLENKKASMVFASLSRRYYGVVLDTILPIVISKGGKYFLSPLKPYSMD